MFLKKKEKSALLKELGKEISRGNIDSGIVPYLRILNKMDGVCTLFCCTGHLHPEDSMMTEEGYIVLRLNKQRFDFIAHNAWKLGEKLKDSITEFCLDYCPWAANEEYKPRVIIRWKIGKCSDILNFLIKLFSGKE